jgi:CubicO group peptidase (beta-lactamase class C family)
MIVTDWQARHGLSGAEHQTAFDELTGRGYRLVKISGYEFGGEPRYASIWYQQGGSAWQARHGISGADYQAAISTLDAQGFRPVDLSVFRVGREVFFSAIWEQELGLEWIARHGLTGTEYQTLFDDLSRGGFRLRCMSAYEDVDGERFACIWDRYAGPDWVARHGLTAEAYQHEFDTQATRGFRLVRAVGYTIGGQNLYAGIWERSPGHPGQARHGLPHDGYQGEFDNNVSAGLRLVDVSGFSDGSSARYTTIWEQTPEANFDADPANGLVVPFMQKWAVPGFSLAVARDGSIRATRVFGYANRITREIVTTEHRFRVASVTKPITSTAVHLLIDQGQLDLTDAVFGSGALLGTTFGTQPYSERLRAVTLQHLLEHSAGGWANDANDPMFQQPTLSQTDLISWTIDNQPLGADPGTQYAYSNFGYCLLGRIAGQVSGLSYGDFVRQSVLNPSGAGSMFLAGTGAPDRASREVMYFGLDRAAPYGIRVDRMDAHGGWAATPSDVLRFLFAVDDVASPPDLLQPATRDAMTAPSTVRPATPTMAGYGRGWAVNTLGTIWHDGTLPGTQAILVRPTSGRAWCATCNAGQPNTALAAEFDDLMWKVEQAI